MSIFNSHIVVFTLCDRKTQKLKLNPNSTLNSPPVRVRKGRLPTGLLVHPQVSGAFGEQMSDENHPEKIKG